MIDAEQVYQALNDGHTVVIDTPEEGTWEFRIDGPTGLVATDREHDDQKYNEAAESRLQGWIHQHGTEWEIER